MYYYALILACHCSMPLFLCPWIGLAIGLETCHTMYRCRPCTEESANSFSLEKYTVKDTVFPFKKNMVILVQSPRRMYSSIPIRLQVHSLGLLHHNLFPALDIRNLPARF